MAYYRTITANAKGRWIGKSLGHVSKEVNARVEGPNEIVRHHDQLKYTLHVHEPYVPQAPLPVIYSDSDLVVIDKPSGIPTHPTVNYYNNTVTELLKPQFGKLVPIYRLDRLTSGVLVLARSGRKASELAHNSKLRHKIYLARVKGKFASCTCELPIVTFNAKRGYREFLTQHAAAKPAKTVFTSLTASDSESFVRCELYTGRTHQIRKHLSLLGHPIFGDPVYGNGDIRRLIEDPTEKNYIAMYDNYEKQLANKETGETCSECGVRLYKDLHENMDLHCALYSMGEREFTSFPSWWASSNLPSNILLSGDNVSVREDD